VAELIGNRKGGGRLEMPRVLNPHFILPTKGRKDAREGGEGWVGGGGGGRSLFEHLGGEDDGQLFAFQRELGAFGQVEGGPGLGGGQLPLLQKLLLLLRGLLRISSC